MPQIVVAAVAAYAGSAVAASTLFANLFFAKLVGALVSTLISVVGSSLFGKQKKPKAASGSGFSAVARDRTQVVRSSIQPRRGIYGEVLTSGPLAFITSTGDSKEYLHLVVIVAAHEVTKIGSVYLNETEIKTEDLGSDGVVTAGDFKDLVRINKHLGSDDQAADADLSAEVTEWTSDHRLRGISYLYLRLKHNDDAFPTGIPNIKAAVKGRKVYDPRIGATVYSTNPALCLRDYLMDPNFGLGATPSEINDAVFNAAANVCDELVDLSAASETFTSDPDDDRLTLDDKTLTMAQGDKVTVSSDGTLPAGLSVGADYYWIREATQSGKLASSYVDALSAIAIDITDAGTGIHTLTRTAQSRYDVNGTVDSDTKPVDNVEDLATSMAGAMIYTQGEYRVYAGAAGTAQVTLDETWLRGSMSVRPRLPRRELFNAVSGTFVDPAREWQPTDFPPVENSLYETQDGDEKFVRDIELPFTTDATRAQRLAKIHLEKSRQGISVEMPCNLKALSIGVWDVVRINSEKFGWSAKEFRVLEWTLSDDLGVNLVLQEEAAASYDWDAGDATDHDPAPDTNLQPATTVAAPGTPQIIESLYITTNSSGVKAKAVVSWAAAADVFVQRYQLEYKTSVASTWTVLPRTTETMVEILDIAAGTYDFRVKAINSLRLSSPYASKADVEILALGAPPAAPNLTSIQAVGGLALLRFDQINELDVRMDGQITFRHHRATSGAQWQNSTSIGEAVPGGSTMALLPLKAGTYLAKAIDSSGVESITPAIIVNTSGTALTFAGVDTLAANPLFQGTHSGTFADGGVLKLGGTAAIDDWTGNVDGINDWDFNGGVKSEGTYSFATGMDLNTVKPVRITGDLDVLIANELDKIDSRLSMFDSWTDFDGTEGASADAQVWERHTDDDPSGSPTWTAWGRVDSSEYSARVFQFQCRLFSDDPSFNIHVSQLNINADEVTL